MKRLLGLLSVIPLASHAVAQERTYGPIRLDYNNARKIDFAIIIPAKNQQNQSLFLGIYCEDRLFNFTGAEGRWKEWEIPVNVHEARIVADACNQL